MDDNDNKKYNLILSKDAIQELDDTILLSGAQYSINFLRANRNFCF